MPFPFTFSLLAPGISNPFSAQTGQTAQSESRVPIHVQVRHDGPGPRRRPTSDSPIVSPVVPLSRKRGWEPSTSGLSLAATSSTSSVGYLDTPAKYREPYMDQNNGRNFDREMEDMVDDLPNKRRRTLVGSIASTALSAALIGTAVGLTVYRLLSSWRDRGKESETFAPPPAYEQGEWVPSQQAQAVVSPANSRHRKVRNTPAGKRAAVRHRRMHTQHHAVSSSMEPEFDFSRADQANEDPEDKMDWIGDKLTQLIHEGQKALGREVVVASEVQEDEIDDDTDAWEEVQQDPYQAGPSSSNHSRSRSESVRRPQRSRDIPLYIPSSHSRSGSTSPNVSPQMNRRFDTILPQSSSLSQFQNVASISIPGSASFRRASSLEHDNFPHSASSSFREDESMWQSPELRESMAKARERYLANRR